MYIFSSQLGYTGENPYIPVFSLHMGAYWVDKIAFVLEMEVKFRFLYWAKLSELSNIYSSWNLVGFHIKGKINALKIDWNLVMIHSYFTHWW